MKNVNKKFLSLVTIIFFSFLNNIYAVEFRGVGSETYSGVKTTKKINSTLETAKKMHAKMLLINMSKAWKSLKE